MSEEATQVLIGGYISKEGALLDYQAVVDADVEINGAVCVSRDLEGNTTVEQTDHLTKRGAVGLGGVGLVVGLFAPPLLAATAVGAAVGGALGKLASSKVKDKIEEEAEQTIPWGVEGSTRGRAGESERAPCAMRRLRWNGGCRRFASGRPAAASAWASRGSATSRARRYKRPPTSSSRIS